jgi:hypothetical protein
MSSNTNNLSDILDEFYWETVNRPVKGIDEGNTDELDVIMSHKRRIEAEAIAAVLALLPEKLTAKKQSDIVSVISAEWFNKAIDQTRRNLIGEQG